MSLFARFKRDIAKHRGRSSVLGVLFVTMVVLSARAFFQLHGPQTAGASVRTTAGLPDAEPAMPAMSSVEAESRINESKKLWQTLREVKPGAVDASVAFAFDASIYPAPPEVVKPTPVAQTEPARTVVSMTPANDPDALKRKHEADIRSEANNLILKMTTLGNGNSPPMAIINQQLLTIGQKILGFEITAIRAREVELIKEGVTVVVKMPEGQ